MNLLLAAVLLMQDKSAEETLKKIEETLLKASALKIRFAFEQVDFKGGREEKVSGTGEIRIKSGNKVDIVSHADIARRRKGTRFVADGVQMSTLRDGKLLGPPSKIWPNIADRMIIGFLRAGISAIDLYAVGKEAVPGEETDVRKRLLVSDFKAGPDDGKARRLAFRCTVPGSPASQDVMLTYDPATYRLLMRRTTIKSGDQVTGITGEQYDEFTLNADIPDEEFKLPEEKK